jgi:uncharacterized protein YqjF (DUF2071 family)
MASLTPHSSLLHTNHRPWPMPDRNWIMRQEWNDLVFLHWEIAPQEIKQHLPPGVEVDLYGDTAWIGVVPFDMKGVTRRGFPAWRWMSDFPEINVRTYVTMDGKPGVWFFSLDVPNRLAVWGARKFYHLPYFHAEMTVGRERDAIQYAHRRGDLTFRAEYRELDRMEMAADSFERWSTERYCLYTADRRGTVYRGQVHHPLWPLHRAEIEVQENTMLRGWKTGAMHPSVLFSRHLPVVVWPLERSGTSARQ